MMLIRLLRLRHPRSSEYAHWSSSLDVPGRSVGQWFGEKPISVMFKKGKSVVRKLALARFGPPSTFEPVLDPERSDPKKGALAARSRSKRTLIVQSLH
ncbi:unnamed protein product [Ilex paraguariensis]|uniref:Uncharacterized protein n=1 Tax=Ilex paraguariensis TaxID=185542 RepID=A0ABC8SNJ3_9AQUA